MLSLKVNFYEYATKQKLRCPVNYNRISCLQLCMKNLTDFAAGSNSENLLPKPLLQSLWKSMPLLYTFRHKPHETKKKNLRPRNQDIWRSQMSSACFLKNKDNWKLLFAGNICADEFMYGALSWVLQILQILLQN